MLPFVYEKLYHEDSIRLLVLEPGVQTDPISCRLEPVQFKSNPQYEAISYAWGDPVSPKHSIIVNGATLEIHENLFIALRYFRYEELPRTLWADAICINQRDIPERNQQVRIMRHIYERSKMTLVWLGQGSKDDEVILDMFRRLEVPVERERSSSDDTVPEYGDDEVIASMASFFSKSWFRRVWILQEFAVSPNVAIFSGKHRISSAVLLRLVTAMYQSSELSFRSADVANLISRISWIMKLRGDFQENIPMHLWMMLIKTAHGLFEATDGRDRVFALLGLAQQETQLHVKPDYSLATSKVITSAVRHCLQAGDEALFTILSAVPATPSTTLRAQLPSWVPDFSAPSGFNRHFSTFEFKAAGLSKPNFSFESNGTVLRLSGVVIDSVRTSLSPPPKCELTPASFCEWYQSCKIVADKSFRYQPEESQLATWWRLMACDLHLSDGIYSRAANGFGKYFLVDEVCAPTLKSEVSFALYQEPIGKIQREYYSAVTNTSGGMNFCVTDLGFLGWVPQLTAPGDEVCVFAGGAAPFIIRKRENGYHELMGDAYIHGLMDGCARDWKDIYIS